MRLTLAAVLTCTVSAAQQISPDTSLKGRPLPAFQSQARLVLLSFHVTHGKDYVANLKPSDIVLLEDGKPREFTIFDAPGAQGRLPRELVLVFDTNPKIEPLWDPENVFRFIPQWEDSMSRAILRKDDGDVRISVYHCAGETLYRSSPATTDTHTLTASLRSLLAPPSSSPEPGAVTPLALPPQRSRVDSGPYTRDYPTSPFFLGEYRGWPMEAAIGVLNEVSAAQDKVARVLVMFSEGIGATTTVPEDVGNQALDLGIPIYPIATNYKRRVRRVIFPRNYFRMHQFEALGKMTGGRAEEYASIDAATLRKILDNVKSDGLAQYVVGFAPTPSNGAPTQHNLEVRLATKAAGALEGGKRRAVY